MSVWALLFITFLKTQDNSYSFKAGKLPYTLRTEQECTQLTDQLKSAAPDVKGEFVCVKITTDNTS